MFGLEKYKDLLGKAGSVDGLRKYRIIGISLLDVTTVMFVCYFISKAIGYSYWITLVILFVIGIIVHRIFGVRTAVDKFLFPTAT
jgi:hypothetical protein